MDYHRSDIAGAENHFIRVLSNADRDRIVSQIFILLISNGEKIISNVNVVVRG